MMEQEENLQDAEERLNDSVPPETIVKYLLKDIEERDLTIKKQNQYIGKLKAYIEELEWKVQNIANGNKELSAQIKREEMYSNLKSQIIHKDNKIKLLKETRDQLIAQLNECTQQKPK